MCSWTNDLQWFVTRPFLKTQVNNSLLNRHRHKHVLLPFNKLLKVKLDSIKRSLLVFRNHCMDRQLCELIDIQEDTSTGCASVLLKVPITQLSIRGNSKCHCVNVPAACITLWYGHFPIISSVIWVDLWMGGGGNGGGWRFSVSPGPP